MWRRSSPASSGAAGTSTAGCCSNPPTVVVDDSADDISASEVYIYCATSAGDSNHGHIYATADIAAKGTDAVLGAEQTR